MDRHPQTSAPHVWHPASHENPVCRLRKALYGLVRSGFDWQEHASDKLRADGWAPCWRGEQSIFQRTFGKHRYLLVVYVDGFILGGSKLEISAV